MMIRGVRGFKDEGLGRFIATLWRPVATICGLIAGLASVLAWVGVGENWPTVTKIFIVVVSLLTILLIYAFYYIYKTFDQPLRVRDVSLGKLYFENQLMVILERCDTVLDGDILTLFVREGDAEIPVCLLSVEAITNKGFLQSVVFCPLADGSLDRLLKEGGIEQLQAKRSVKRSTWNV